MNIDWPADKLKVYILDDGRRREFWEFAKSCEVGYIVRSDNKHAKAGNINHALRKTSGDYIAIFDCDHIPTRSFLQVAMGWFTKDERLAMVQTPHHFYSPDPFERNLDTFRQIPNEGALFYGVIQDGSDFWNATFFCGSCAVLRRTAIEEIGGIAVETVTEDAHTALRMQRRGWNTAYIRFPQAAGLATGSLGAHIGQRIRWARGMVQILRIDNPLFGKGLKLSQRLCYLNSMMHYLFAIPRLVFLVSPAVYLLLGHSNIYGFGEAIFAYALPHLAFATLMNSRIQGKYRYSFWNEVYETVLAPYILLPTTFALISPKHGKFNVTSKEDVIDQRYFDWKLAAPYLVLLSINLACVVTGIVRTLTSPSNHQTIALNVLWSLLNIIILGVANAVAHEATQRRSSVRIATRIPVFIARGEHRWNTTTVDISRGGIAIPLPAEWNFAPGERMRAIFKVSGEELTFPIVLIANEEGNVRFSFGVLSLEKEDALVRVIFGRADAWLNWRESAQDDRPLLSFLTIVGISLQGIAVIPRATLALLNRPARRQAKGVEMPMRRLIAPPLMIAFFLLGLLTLGTQSARAQGVEPKSTFSDVLDLAALGHSRALLMHGASDHANLTFGIPLTKVTTEATLALNYRASIGMAAKVSSISVSLNGTSITTIPVSQSSIPESFVSAEVTIPADLLTTDNSLLLTLDGRCAPGCNGGGPADLWLEVEPATQLRLQGSILALHNDLRLLPEPFFDSSGRGQVTAQIAFDENPDHTTIEAAGIIASWFGQLADHRRLHFSATVGGIPGGNVIVFARRRSALAASLGLDAGAGPLVALRDNPLNTFGKLLVVTGTTSEDLRTAARALASGQYPRKGDAAELGDFRMPPAREAYDAPRWLNTSHSTPLGQQLSPEDLKVYGTGSVKLYFQLPPDLYFGQQQYVPLHLIYDLAKWPSGVAGELRIHLNRTLVTTRPIPRGSSKRHQVEEIGLPISALTLGNTLTLEFSTSASRASSALAGMEATVSTLSSVDLSGLAHFVDMPRLDLFANAGFPFTKLADLSETAIVLNDDVSAHELGFYLELMGFFGARTGYPVLRVSVISPTDSAAATGKDLLILSANPHESPIDRLIGGSVQVSQSQLKLLEPSFPLAIFRWLPSSLSEARRGVEEVFSADPAPDGFLSEFGSPLGGGHMAVAVRAMDIAKFEPLADVFAGEANVAHVYGSLAMIQGGQFHSFVLQPKAFHQGNLDPLEQTRLWIATHYWSLPLFLLAITGLLSFRIHHWLEERAELRLDSQK